MLSMVLFPPPELPVMATKSPVSTASEMPLRTCTSWGVPGL